MTSPNISRLNVGDNFRLLLEWADGTRSEHDLSQIVNGKAWAEALRDPAMFARAELKFDGREIAWPGTDIEFSADGLWEDRNPRAAAQWMSAGEFRTWLAEMRFNWHQAADALGISRRSIAYYSKGDQPIPKTVWLSCMQLASAVRRSLPQFLDANQPIISVTNNVDAIISWSIGPDASVGIATVTAVGSRLRGVASSISIEASGVELFA